MDNLALKRFSSYRGECKEFIDVHGFFSLAEEANNCSMLQGFIFGLLLFTLSICQLLLNVICVSMLMNQCYLLVGKVFIK